jgi:hypothetical protein
MKVEKTKKKEEEKFEKVEVKSNPMKDQLLKLLETRGYKTTDEINTYLSENSLEVKIEEIESEDDARDLLLTLTPL